MGGFISEAVSGRLNVNSRSSALISGEAWGLLSKKLQLVQSRVHIELMAKWEYCVDALQVQKQSTRHVENLRALALLEVDFTERFLGRVFEASCRFWKKLGQVESDEFLSLHYS